MENFPFPLVTDPLREGDLAYNPLLDYMIAIPALMGINKDVWAAVLPPILGAITLIPIYFLGREIGGRSVGLIGAGLCAILPTEFLFRSTIGFTDHHVLEVLFSVSLILFTYLAMKRGTFRWTILAGIALGLFSLAWSGFLLFLPLILGWFVVMFLYNYSKGKDNKWLCKVVLGVGGIGFAIFLPYWVYSNLLGIYLLLFTTLIAIPVVFYFLSKLGNRKIFWGTLVGLFAGGMGLIGIVHPGLLVDIWNHVLRVFIPGAGYGTVGEVMMSDWGVILGSYGICIFMFVGGLGIYIKRGGNLLVILWTLLMLACMIAERRWGYYFVVPLALFSGYIAVEGYRWIAQGARLALVIIILCIVVLPMLGGIISKAELGPSMTPGWYSACTYLRENTPEPFEVEDFYTYRGNMGNASYEVMSWWDWGFFIIKEGHRVPVADPGQRNVLESADFLVNGIGDYKYVVLGDHRAIYPAFEVWLGMRPSQNNVYNSYYWKVYSEQESKYVKVFEEGGIKVFEHQ